jgi:hypothetical protein
MTEPHWWIAGPNNISFSAPCSKRKQDPSTPMRGVAPYQPMRPPLGENPYYPPSRNLGGLYDSIHADPYPMKTKSSTSSLGPSNPDIDSQGGWNDVPFVHKMMQGQKKALKVQQRIAAGIPPRGTRACCIGGLPSGKTFVEA